jgi:hypothetical protein
MDEGLHYYMQAHKIENISQDKVNCKLIYSNLFLFFIILNIYIPKCCLLINNVNCASSQT